MNSAQCSVSSSLTYYVRGDAALVTVDLTGAIQLFRQAEKCADDAEPRARCAHNLACAFGREGSPSTALEHADRARGLLPAGTSHPLLGQIELARSNCLCESSRPDVADSGFRRAAAVFEEHSLLVARHKPSTDQYREQRDAHRAHGRGRARMHRGRARRRVDRPAD